MVVDGYAYESLGPLLANHVSIEELFNLDWRHEFIGRKII